MVSSTPANLIPYDRWQYAMLPREPVDSLVPAKGKLDRQYRFQRPPTAKITAADPLGSGCNRYDRNQCWQYADDYQIGARVDLYA